MSFSLISWLILCTLKALFDLKEMGLHIQVLLYYHPKDITENISVIFLSKHISKQALIWVADNLTSLPYRV